MSTGQQPERPESSLPPMQKPKTWQIVNKLWFKLCATLVEIQY